jgi:hypothetical protein
VSCHGKLATTKSANLRIKVSIDLDKKAVPNRRRQWAEIPWWVGEDVDTGEKAKEVQSFEVAFRSTLPLSHLPLALTTLHDPKETGLDESVTAGTSLGLHGWNSLLTSALCLPAALSDVDQAAASPPSDHLVFFLARPSQD